MMPTWDYYASGYNNNFTMILNNRYHVLTANSVSATVLRAWPALFN